jgi:hypothetical protein
MLLLFVLLRRDERNRRSGPGPASMDGRWSAFADVSGWSGNVAQECCWAQGERTDSRPGTYGPALSSLCPVSGHRENRQRLPVSTFPRHGDGQPAGLTLTVTHAPDRVTRGRHPRHPNGVISLVPHSHEGVPALHTGGGARDTGSLRRQVVAPKQAELRSNPSFCVMSPELRRFAAVSAASTGGGKYAHRGTLFCRAAMDCRKSTSL